MVKKKIKEIQATYSEQMQDELEPIERADERVRSCVMKKKISWNELDFDLKKDGYFATPTHIKQRIKEKQKQDRIVRLTAFGLILTGLAFLSLVGWLMI